MKVIDNKINIAEIMKLFTPNQLNENYFSQKAIIIINIMINLQKKKKSTA